MTTEEQKSIIGGTVLEYAEVKRQIAALNEKLDTALNTVRSVEHAIRMRQQNLARLLEDWPTAQYFTDLLNEIDEKVKRKHALEQTIKEYGLDL